MYDDHGGIALAQEEGAAIAKALGKNNSVCMLQNHGFVAYHLLSNFPVNSKLKGHEI